MKHKLPHPGFELGSLIPFPPMKLITPNPPLYVWVCMHVCVCKHEGVYMHVNVKVYACVCMCVCVNMKNALKVIPLIYLHKNYNRCKHDSTMR